MEVQRTGSVIFLKLLFQLQSPNRYRNRGVSICMIEERLVTFPFQIETYYGESDYDSNISLIVVQPTTDFLLKWSDLTCTVEKGIRRS